VGWPAVKIKQLVLRLPRHIPDAAQAWLSRRTCDAG
jgi:hypothetical protein